MKNNDFVHLHLHTEFSQLDGLGSAKQYFDRAKKLCFDAIAITDHGNIDGAVKWQKEANAHGIKPIFGCEFYIVPNLNIKEKGEKRGHIVLLAKNRKGYVNILNLLNIANIYGFFYRPRIDYETLLKHLDGVIVLTACPLSFINLDGGIVFLKKLIRQKKDDFYFEIMPSFFEVEGGVKQLNRNFLIAKHFRIKTVATNDCHYLKKEDAIAQEVLLAIQRKSKWNDKNRFRFTVTDLFFMTKEELIDKFRSVFNGCDFDFNFIVDAVDNTNEVASKCNFSLSKTKVVLPKVIDAEEDSKDFLWKLILTGLKEKRRFLVDKVPVYLKRARREFEIINRMGFVDYFLIVWDLINWCKKENILVGPGRGSVSGSVIAYLIGITLVDPLKYGLIFERFISDFRVDLPDIDIDVEDRYRDKIKQYLSDKYGEKNVANISTFLRMKTRMVLKDVCRVFDIDFNKINNITKNIKFNQSLKEFFETEEGKNFYKKYKKQCDIAITLENQIRGSGQHAAGVVINNKSFMEDDKTYLVKRGNFLVCNWDKRDVEFVGMLKLDVLGLSTLSVFHYAFDLIYERHKKKISFEDIPLNDTAVFNEFEKGNCVGIFQFNTYGLTNLVKKVKIDSFDTLAILTALHRPAPLQSGLVDEYIERKNGTKVIEKDIFYKILKQTHGIVVFQEQIMQIINALSGLSLSVCDVIRKLLDKQNVEELNKKFLSDFVEGCIKNGFDEKEAKEIWKSILQWGGYAFNKSHAYAYTLLSYYGMWLKVNYPIEYLCALLTYGVNMNKDEIISEALRLGFGISLPKHKISDPFLWIINEDVIFMPLIEIKGIGEKTALKISKYEFNYDKLTAKIKNILKQIKFFDSGMPQRIKDLVSFDISFDNERKIRRFVL